MVCIIVLLSQIVVTPSRAFCIVDLTLGERAIPKDIAAPAVVGVEVIHRHIIPVDGVPSSPSSVPWPPPRGRAPSVIRGQSEGKSRCQSAGYSSTESIGQGGSNPEIRPDIGWIIIPCAKDDDSVGRETGAIVSRCVSYVHGIGSGVIDKDAGRVVNRAAWRDRIDGRRDLCRHTPGAGGRS